MSHVEHRVSGAGSWSPLTSSGTSLPGVAAMPVMKSLVMKGLMTTDRWHEGCFWRGSRSKCSGVRMIGIWLIFPA